MNIGNNKTISLKNFIKLIETNLGLKANIKYQSFQKGDIFKTHASINKINKFYGFLPKTKIESGVKKFVNWFIENKGKYKIGEKIKIPAKRVPAFTAGKMFKDRVQG